MGLQDFCFGFYVVTSEGVLYLESAFTSPFLFLGVLLELSSWVERDALELRCSQGVVLEFGCGLIAWFCLTKELFRLYFELVFGK